MLTKEKVLASMSELPPEFTLDDLVEQLIFIQKIERGMQQMQEGKGIPHDEIKALVKSWQK
jgi:predicted transcriptional regulator